MSFGFLQAQERLISGKILNANSQEVIAGVSVSIENHFLKETTDGNGGFTLKFDDLEMGNYILNISKPGFESFVGKFPIPLRHGLTIGELARLCNDTFGLNATLEVLPLEGWQRGLYHDDTRLPWVLPSPNLPTLDSAIVYPGTVLFEGTNLSEGRGTTKPFELVGAPWLEAHRLTRLMTQLGLPGVRFRPAEFQPTFQKHAGQTCGGCQLHVTDRTSFQPVLTAVALLEVCRRLAPDCFAWRQPPYEYETVIPPIDILSGSDHLRQSLEAEVPYATIADTWSTSLISWPQSTGGRLA